MKKLIVAGVLTIVIIAVFRSYRLPALKLPNLPSINTQKQTASESTRVVYEESVVTSVVEKSLPSVVTIGVVTTQQMGGLFEFDPFNPFFNFRRNRGPTEKVDRNIGSGFIISEDGLIITNKHVVSDSESSYKVLTNDGVKYDVQKIYRDPSNDLAILKIQAQGLKPLPLGDSDALKLGQMAIAIGTPLGEFTNTVTVGIVSGLGRGITAGSPFEGFVEKLDGVIQTDAAINPGNSGGPLLNSKGQVIGVNSAIAQEGQNIGFAIPVKVVEKLIKQFESRGSTFERPYIGIQYQTIDRRTAILNELPEGAYIERVVPDSPAEAAGVEVEDIITGVDNVRLSSSSKDLAEILSEKSIGQKVRLSVWREGKTIEIEVTVGSQS